MRNGLPPSKKALEIFLSKLKEFRNPKIKLEQYITPSHIAADILWFAYMQGDIENRIVADLGAGTGILGIGALILGAKKVYFLEVDPEATEILRSNISLAIREFQPNGEYKILESDVRNFKDKVDTVIMNPPFGVKVRNADLKFIDKACEVSTVIHSIHKAETMNFLRSYYSRKGFKITHFKIYEFPIKATYPFHEKPVEHVKVIWIRSVREDS